MNLTFDEAWIRDYCERTGKPLPPELAPASAKQPRRKYGNQPTVRHGKKFDSKHEADVYDDLLLEMRAGIFAAVACQVDFVLPGGVRYRADFVAMRPGGNEYRVIDAKSEATRKDKTYRLKRRQMRECLGIEIEER